MDDLHIKISDILGKYLKDTPMRQSDAITLVDDLANLMEEVVMIHYSIDGIETACGVYAIGEITNDISKVTCPECKQNAHEKLQRIKRFIRWLLKMK